jgi:CRP-like cAMP-binding protein
VVATWDAAQVEPAFKACPWVEDDLRASANKMQALVGVTLGPLADRLDATLRAQVTSRLELRELAEGDVIVEQGHAVKELCLVGQGAIELVKDGQVVGEISVGEFLFATEIMGGGKATATARAGKGGALLLASDRSVAQELMMTCPPLLEIFAGM